MTTPRPPRPTPPRRTPKVAGRGPARPATNPPLAPADETISSERDTRSRRPRFARKPKPAQPVSETQATAPVEQTPPEETPAEGTSTVEGSRSPDTVGDADAGTSADSSSADTTSADATTADATTADADAVSETRAAPVAPEATTRLEKTPAPSEAPRGKNRPTTKVSTIKPNSPGPSARPVLPGDTYSSPRRSLPGWTLVGVVAALAVVFGIVAAVAALKPGVSLSSNEAFVDSSVTSQVTSQANSRVCSIFAVNYADVEAWQRRASADLTGKAAEEFQKSLPGLRKAVVDLGLTSGGVDCKIDTIGVRSVDGNSAVLIANVLVSETQNQRATGSGSTRYQVSMRKTGGKWLISDFDKF